MPCVLHLSSISVYIAEQVRYDVMKFTFKQSLSNSGVDSYRWTHVDESRIIKNSIWLPTLITLQVRSRGKERLEQPNKKHVSVEMQVIEERPGTIDTLYCTNRAQVTWRSSLNTEGTNTVCFPNKHLSTFTARPGKTLDLTSGNVQSCADYAYSL
jgi:hypothetical protein